MIKNTFTREREDVWRDHKKYGNKPGQVRFSDLLTDFGQAPDLEGRAETFYADVFGDWRAIHDSIWQRYGLDLDGPEMSGWTFIKQGAETIDSEPGTGLPPAPGRSSWRKACSFYDAVKLLALYRGFIHTLWAGMAQAQSEGRSRADAIFAAADVFVEEILPGLMIMCGAVISPELGIADLTAWIAANSKLGTGGDPRLARLLETESKSSGNGSVSNEYRNRLPAYAASPVMRWLDSGCTEYLSLPSARTTANREMGKELRPNRRNDGQIIDCDVLDLDGAAPPAEEEAEAHLLAEAIRAAVSQSSSRPSPERLRIFDLHIQGRTGPEIAAELRIAPGTVYSTINHIRKVAERVTNEWKQT